MPGSGPVPGNSRRRRGGPGWTPTVASRRPFSRTILALGVLLELGGVEVHFPEVALAVAHRLVVEVRRGGMAALPAGADRPGSHAVSEFHHRDEAVAAGAVELPGSFVPAGPEGGQGAPARRGEGNRDTGARIAERLDDVAGEPLETIDLAPRNLPASVVPGELGGSGRQRAQQLGRGGTGRDVFVSRHT